MSQTSLKVFLSTVTNEFLPYRVLLKGNLVGLPLEVKVQEDFLTLPGTTLDKLDEYIKGCDLVFHLVGDMTGARPKRPEVDALKQRYSDFAQRVPCLQDVFKRGDEYDLSYTQWEAYLALYHEKSDQKKLAIYLPLDSAPRDGRYVVDHDQKTAQEQHLQRLCSLGRDRGTFADEERLSSSILRCLVHIGLIERVPAHGASVIVRDLFKGRACIIDAGVLQKPASEEELGRFYAGALRLNWNIVAAQGIVKRDQQAEVLDKLLTPSERTRLTCLVGEPGAGKSSMAWQLAYELIHQQTNPVLQILDATESDVWYRMVEFAARINVPFYVLVDDLFRDDGVVRALKALDPNLPLTIVATSKANEYRGKERFPFPVEHGQATAAQPNGEKVDLR